MLESLLRLCLSSTVSPAFQFSLLLPLSPRCMIAYLSLCVCVRTGHSSKVQCASLVPWCVLEALA